MIIIRTVHPSTSTSPSSISLQRRPEYYQAQPARVLHEVLVHAAVCHRNREHLRLFTYWVRGKVLPPSPLQSHLRPRSADFGIPRDKRTEPCKHSHALLCSNLFSGCQCTVLDVLSKDRCIKCPLRGFLWISIISYYSASGPPNT